MTTVARRVKPSWTGNSGIPLPPEEVVELAGVVEVVELAGVVDVVTVVRDPPT